VLSKCLSINCSTTAKNRRNCRISQSASQAMTSLGALPARMHGLPYNMVAYAFSTLYQNSNQWALELIAAASAGEGQIASRQQAQAWLRSAGYRPNTLHIDAMTRLGGRMFKANIAFDDHPFDRRMAGQIDTVTVDSVFRFVESKDPESRRIRLALP